MISKPSVPGNRIPTRISSPYCFRRTFPQHLMPFRIRMQPVQLLVLTKRVWHLRINQSPFKINHSVKVVRTPYSFVYFSTRCFASMTCISKGRYRTAK